MISRILLCTVGTTPQVVTETLYLLLREPTPWIPDRIEIVSTGGGVERILKVWPAIRAAFDIFFPGGAPPVGLYALRVGEGGPMALEWAGGASAAPTWSTDGRPALRRDIQSVRDVEGVGDLIKDRIWAHVSWDGVRASSLDRRGTQDHVRARTARTGTTGSGAR